MTRYTVVWHQEALDELARLWIDAPDRTAVTLAASAIDRHLAADAPEKGTPVPDNLRQLTIPPLRVLFAVSELDRIARIFLAQREIPFRRSASLKSGPESLRHLYFQTTKRVWMNPHLALRPWRKHCVVKPNNVVTTPLSQCMKLPTTLHTEVNCKLPTYIFPSDNTLKLR